MERKTRKPVINWKEVKKVAGKLPKLAFVLVCYTLLFYQMFRMVRWFSSAWREEPLTNLISYWEWKTCKDCLPRPREVIRHFAVNMIVFGAFAAQHTILAERKWKGSIIHQKVFNDWKINKGIYTLSTGIVIKVMIDHWRITPIYVWKLVEWGTFFKVVQILAWFILYGTTIMQDLPELVGFDQAVFVDNCALKSPRFREMLNRQRHLGIIPFTVLALATEVMTFDRLLFLLMCATYSLFMWKEEDTKTFDYVHEMTKKKVKKLHIGTRRKLGR